MRGTILPALAMLLAGQAAQAATPATASGGGALALAALVAQHSLTLSRQDRRTLLFLLGGRPVPTSRQRNITVAADSVACQAGNVDVNAWSCTLSFAGEHASLAGREAHELYATLAEVGVPPDGAAGTIHEGVVKLNCVIDPKAIAQKDGGGASCTFKPGAP